MVALVGSVVLLTLSGADSASAQPTDPWLEPNPQMFVYQPAPWEPADVIAAAAAHGWPVAVIYRKEVGGVGYDPYAVGRLGEQGPGQLKPNGGLLADFLRWSGGGDPHDPWLVADYIEHTFARGGACNWAYMCA